MHQVSEVAEMVEDGGCTCNLPYPSELDKSSNLICIFDGENEADSD